MKIGKILIGSLLASSSIGNAGGTIFKTYDFHNLERTLATTEKFDYYNGFTEIQPQIGQGFAGSYGVGGLTPITYGCAEGCTQVYQATTAACLLIVEPITQAICHAAYAACLAAC